jgi:hypothetical protein
VQRKKFDDNPPSNGWGADAATPSPRHETSGAMCDKPICIQAGAHIAGKPARRHRHAAHAARGPRRHAALAKPRKSLENKPPTSLCVDSAQPSSTKRGRLALFHLGQRSLVQMHQTRFPLSWRCPKWDRPPGPKGRNLTPPMCRGSSSSRVLSPVSTIIDSLRSYKKFLRYFIVSTIAL